MKTLDKLNNSYITCNNNILLIIYFYIYMIHFKYILQTKMLNIKYANNNTKTN